MSKKADANIAKYRKIDALESELHQEMKADRERLRKEVESLRRANQKLYKEHAGLRAESVACRLREQFFRKTHFARETGVIVLTACGLYAPFLTEHWRMVYYGVIASAVTSYILGTWFSRVRLVNDE